MTAADRYAASLPLTIGQTAEITTLHPNTIRRGIQAGAIEAVYVSERRIIITAGEVSRLITQGMSS